MPITDREPDLPVMPPQTLASVRGAFKLLLHDPSGIPSRYSHEEWRHNWLAESVRQLPGWNAATTPIAPEPTPDPSELLTLVARSDGRSWPAGVGKKDDFVTQLTRLAMWAQAGRLITFGLLPSPSRLIRSPAVTWDVATKEQWASWWDAVWPSVQSYGRVLESPRLLVGDEVAWAFARPGDHVVCARGLSPFGLAQRLRSALASVQFSRVDICVGLAWAETMGAANNTQCEETWSALYYAFQEIASTLVAEGYGQDGPDMADLAEGTQPPYRMAFIEPPHCNPDEPGSRLGPFSYRSYFRTLAISAAGAAMPVIALPEGAWQEPELPGMLAKRHIARTGAGVEPKSRQWTPARKGRK